MWDSVEPPKPDRKGTKAGKYINSLMCAKNGVVMGVGNNGLFVSSADSAETWEIRQLEEANGKSLYSIVEIPGKVGRVMIMGEDCLVLQSDDFGDTWVDKGDLVFD